MKEGWEIKRLGDVCELYQPKTISTKEMVDDGDYPVFGANGIIGKYDKYNHEEPQLLITCRGATCGSINVSEPKSWINGNAMVVRPKDNSLNLKFIEYLFLGGIDISKTITGAAQPQITRQTLSPVLISYPQSLPEQHRIVSILDKAFAAIDKAKANAEQNLKNAKELFESYLQGVFENKGEGWEEKKFEEVCVLQRGFDLPTHSRFEGEFPLVSSNGITDRISEWKVKAPGVVTGRSGTIGNVHFIEEDFWPLNTALYIKDFFGNFERCIYYFLLQFDLGKYSSGAGVPTLNRNNVHSEVVWFPKSIKEQQTIVRKLDALRSETKRLEKHYTKKIADLDELKKSILQKAFNGELNTEVELENTQILSQ
jgi:type I restriction enzyme S subunit